MSDNDAQPSAPAGAAGACDPPWSGWIETTGDALLILEAARRGLIPRVTRRLVDSERKMITSGSVFVFDEDESGIKRWTDGFFWSPSRILGNFLLYRETDKRGAGHRGAAVRSDNPPIPDDAQYTVDGVKMEGHSLSRPKGESSQMGIDRHRERTLMGSLTNSFKFKPEGLMKKTFSLTIGGVAQHLISYYKIEDVENGRLRCPSSLPELASLDISPEYLDKEHFRNPPKVEIGVDGLPRYRGDADIEDDDSPTMLSAPLSTGVPLLKSVNDASSSKRSKRYDPYGSTTPKRARKTKSLQQLQEPEQSSVVSQPTSSPTHPQEQQQQASMYADPNASGMPYPPYTMPPYYQMPGYPHPQMHAGAPYPQQPGPSPQQQPPLQSQSQPQSQSPQASPPPPVQQPQAQPYAYNYAQNAEQQQQQQQAYHYQYYPPPPPGYPVYPPGTWPYGYPPPPHAMQHQQQPGSVIGETTGENDGKRVDEGEQDPGEDIGKSADAHGDVRT